LMWMLLLHNCNHIIFTIIWIGVVRERCRVYRVKIWLVLACDNVSR
jgi:hypothetical protein